MGFPDIVGEELNSASRRQKDPWVVKILRRNVKHTSILF